MEGTKRVFCMSGHLRALLCSSPAPAWVQEMERKDGQGARVLPGEGDPVCPQVLPLMFWMPHGDQVPPRSVLYMGTARGSLYPDTLQQETRRGTESRGEGWVHGATLSPVL